MEIFDWAREIPGGVTICDSTGIILYMNDKSAAIFADDGGRDLIGRNLMDCHSEESRRKLAEIMRTRQPNVYTIEKKGIKKLIYQTPWFQDGEFAGLVEISLEIPFDMPHFIRG